MGMVSHKLKNQIHSIRVPIQNLIEMSNDSESNLKSGRKVGRLNVGRLNHTSASNFEAELHESGTDVYRDGAQTADIFKSYNTPNQGYQLKATDKLMKNLNSLNTLQMASIRSNDEETVDRPGFMQPADQNTEERQATIQTQENEATRLADKDFEPEIIEIRKSQHDSVAGVFYSNGVSLVHIALLAGWATIIWPDIEKATSLEKTKGVLL